MAVDILGIFSAFEIPMPSSQKVYIKEMKVNSFQSGIRLKTDKWEKKEEKMYVKRRGGGGVNLFLKSILYKLLD